ncbi:MAG: DUF2341 domain-containing protein [Candidatus Nitrosoabyssus spongiisocia]|nr:MAG: DUF2341 domain-containing protein [Nitrosopumilaceae archaeon AB1(1)]
MMSSFSFTNISLNITAFGNDGSTTAYLDVSPPISYSTANFSVTYNRPGSLSIFEFGSVNFQRSGPTPVQNNVIGPPSFSSAYTDTTGSNITVVFSENIAVGSTTFLSDFAIINSSTSIVSITSNNATSIILSLNSTLSLDDSPLLSYNDTGTNITTSLHPTLSLANFTNQPITNNVLPPPIFVNAYTNQRGDSIIVNFDKVVTLISTASPTDFAVNISGITTTSITKHNDTAINLTLDSSISSTSSLTLSYNQTTSNITNVNDLSLANFINQPITNNVLPPPIFVNAYTNQRGDNITVNFDREITLTNTTSPTDFAVNISGITTTSITRHNDTAINLTLDSSISSTSSLTLSYNQTTSDITNVNDLSLANFINQPITNNVLPPPIFVNAYTNQRGDNITVNFDREITLTNTTSPTDFAVSISGIATTSITKHNDTAINLTLDSNIPPALSLTLSYSQTTSNITNVNNLSLANFINQPITNNVLPPPIFVNAYTNQRGDNITVNFDREITLTNTTSPTDFAVNISGITTTSITKHNDTAINLTLDSSISSTSSLTLSYNQTTSDITNVNDLSLANFINQPITNNVLPPPIFVNAYTNQRGDNITVNFDREITLTNTTSPTDFAVNISGITTTSITRHNDTAINLTLDSSISSTSSLTLSYNQTTSDITNVNDLSLANFINQPITNNVLPPPIFVNAYTNQRGDNITVNFDREITLTNTTSPTDFAVSISGIATTSITRHNDTAINLTLDSNIPPALSLTLSYSQTTSNITNVNNLSLANFINQPITNNVPFFDLPSLWDTRQKITINSNQITTILQNFTLLVSISDSALSNSSVLPNGADIIFTSSDGFTILPHEIESFTNNATIGTLVAWVRLPTLSSTSDTILYMYYNVSLATTIIHDNVWDSDYEIIYHMDQSTFGAQSTLDSSGNNRHATPLFEGSTPFDSNDLVSAQIGNGINFDGVDHANGVYLELPDLTASLFYNTNFTISVWANIDVLKNWARIVDFGKGQDDNNILIAAHRTNPHLRYDMRQGTSSDGVTASDILQTGQWAYFTVVHESSGTATIYKNGASITSGAVHTSLDENRASNYIGRSNWGTDSYFDGKFDEFRLSSTARSADWIATEYANQNSPSTFLTFSAPEDRSVAITSAITNTQGYNIIITFNENIIYSVIPTTDFALNGTSATIDSITSDSSSITLNLSRNLLANETITISYTKTSGGINSTQSTDITLENFVNQPVNNNVLDTTPPVITLNGNATVYVELGSSYSEQNATTDDGSLVIIGGDTVNSSLVGNYTITYHSADSSGNNATQVNRIIVVRDTTPPAITLIGNATVYVELG